MILLCAGSAIQNENIFLSGTITHCDDAEQCLFEYFYLDIFPDSSMNIISQDSSISFIEADDDTSDVPFSALRKILLTETGKLKFDSSGNFYTFLIPGNKDTVFTDSAGSIVKLSFNAGNIHYEVLPDSLFLP